jgi:multidrug resistance efflux pump
VKEGAQVKAGQILVELEPFDLKERLAEADALLAQRLRQYEQFQSGYRAEEKAQAEAKYKQLAAQLDKLRSGPRKQEISAATDQLELAKAELLLAQQKHDRTKALFDEGTTTQESMDEASAQLKVARARVEAQAEQLALLNEGTREEDVRAAEAQLEEAKQAWELLKNGYRPKEIEQAKAAVDAAQAAVAAIKKQLEELEIAAPVSGSVEAVELQPGELVSPNAPAMSMLDLSHLWVRAYVPENKLAVRIGQEVRVTVDSYPKQRFSGRISYIANQAEFTPGNVQTPEDRSKQVFRINVDLLDGLDRLRPGMAADVWLEER